MFGNQYDAGELVRAAVELSGAGALRDDYLDAELAILDLVHDGATKRALNWVLRLHAYERHWAVAGRAPRENTRDRSALPVGERRLGEWARYQRRFEADLTEYQRARLDVSRPFEWDPWAANWERQLVGCRQHLAREGQLPTLTGADAVEFRLARWLARALRLKQIGQLDPGRSEALAELLHLSRVTPARRGGGAWRTHQQNAESST